MNLLPALPLGVRILITTMAIASGFLVGFYRFSADGPPPTELVTERRPPFTVRDIEGPVGRKIVVMQLSEIDQCEADGGIGLKGARPNELVCVKR
jgi:hypothetical protein